MEPTAGQVASLHRVTVAVTKLDKQGQAARHILVSIDGRTIELAMEQWTWLISHPQIYLR